MMILEIRIQNNWKIIYSRLLKMKDKYTLPQKPLVPPLPTFPHPPLLYNN